MHLRIATPEDGEAIAEIYAPIVQDTYISFETEAPSAVEMQKRIESTLRMWPWLVATEANRIMGYAYASEHRKRPAYRWSVDVTAYVAENAQGQGVGKELYIALIEILRLQRFRSAFAGIALPNAASVALHESVGFRPVGVYQDVGFKLASWRSVGWWGLTLSESNQAPSEPIPFADLSSSILSQILGSGATNIPRTCG